VALVLACRGDSASSRDTARDTLAPVGSGTERLLTRERLSLIDGWIRATITRTGNAPRSLDDVRPPEEEASRYIPLERFLRDGWGREITYEYIPASRSYELRSSGEDGAPGTSDDLTLKGGS
jgi:Type II secretion system (T2SS), protein G